MPMWLLLAADEGPGRGDDPSPLGGVLTIVGVILLVAAVAAAGLWLAVTLSRRRKGDRTADGESHDPGRVGRP